MPDHAGTERGGYELRPPRTSAEWAAYHDIRRVVLFERRGRFGAYDAHHPDEHRAGNHPLLLVVGGEALGTVRVDVDGARATIRRVAVREDVQRRGHGRRMLALAEAFARARGCAELRSHVDRDAVGFYERCGWTLVDAEDAEHAGGATRLMTKPLP